MKIYGYETDTGDGSSLLRLEEIAIQATPEALRKLSVFILKTAESMENHGNIFGHEHYKDFLKDFGEVDDEPDIIITAEE